MYKISANHIEKLYNNNNRELLSLQLDLKHVDQERGSNIVRIGIDLKEFYHSVEWDILEVPATRNEEYYMPQSSNVANGLVEGDVDFEIEEDEAQQYKAKLLTGKLRAYKTKVVYDLLGHARPIVPRQ